MNFEVVKKSVINVLKNMPSDWPKLTTHRLDIYQEELAKVQFLKEFEKLLSQGKGLSEKELITLPTAFDYIRLGHPLSCILEWAIAKINGVNEENVISFSSQTMPVLAILRKNLLCNVATRIVYKDKLPINFDDEVLQSIYGYKFDLMKIGNNEILPKFNGSTIKLLDVDNICSFELSSGVDFAINFHSELGSIVLAVGDDNEKYISEIQHVRRRESIAMNPRDSHIALEKLVGKFPLNKNDSYKKNKNITKKIIKEITNTTSDAAIASSGLSIQYAILMGLIHHSFDNNTGKAIKLIVPPNCYGGTNDQARRVAACIKNVEVMDLPVDGGQDMVQSIEKVLEQVASEDAVPFIIAEIPTNPRVEVPDLEKLKLTLSKSRKTKKGNSAIGPVFILDQTFCPNVQLLGPENLLSSVKTISYVSGSKFPSGGLCTAGYCVANLKAEELMNYISNHLKICTNEATPFQVEILSKQMPSMLQRIVSAYKNTRKFVNFIEKTLPEAKINFVSEELANAGFTPSVFSLDLPTKGNTPEEKESYKRDLNLKLINMMISEIPHESKYCVSYGQLRGCYWTIPATSTQGTTQEGDKDYIVRVAISNDFDLELHKKIFLKFCKQEFK